MKKKFQLAGLAMLITLSGCASNKVWSPELEKARETYSKVSADPLVTSLAASELDRAKKQLQVAQDAQDFFKGNEVISHEAVLATIRSLEALQTARALAAKDNLRLAQAGLPIPANPSTYATTESAPTMAAATPNASSTMAAPQMAAPQLTANYSQPESTATQSVTQTEVQMIAQQLAALSQQIQALQARIEGGALQTAAPAMPATTMAAVMPAATASYNAYNSSSFNPEIEPDLAQEAYPRVEEPRLGAALAAPQEQAPAAPMVASDARLREELRAMNARPSSRGMSLTLGERYFEANSARLWTGRAARHLDNIAAVMVENPGLTIDIDGHTDNTGSAATNNNLSADRAIAIKSALVLRGVNASRINSTGYGDTAPIADNDTQLGRLQNRRVEVIFPNVSM